MKEYTLKTWTVNRDELPGVAQYVAAALSENKKFSIWLRGDLGAGKTTFAGELLHALGLPQNIPVLSPTFTFMTEYQTKFGLIAHLDLYRLADNDEDAVDFLLSGRDFSGLIVEWPERAPNSSLIAKTHELRLSFSDQYEQRDIIFSSTRSVTA